MNYKEIIDNPLYEEITSLSHDEIKPFITNEISINQGWARVANMYQLLGLLTFILGTFKAFIPFYAKREHIDLVYLFTGIVFLFTVNIVLHELIHGLAYRCIGVKHLSFGMHLKKFIFYVQADGEVLGYRQFKIVALAPTIMLGALSLIGMIVFYNQPLFYFFLSILALHSFCCSGDFGMLCFFQNKKHEEILTFDRKSEGKTYFYKRK